MNINNHFKKIYYLFKAIGNQIKQWFLELSRVWQAIVIAVILVLILGGYRFLTKAETVPDVATAPRAVQLALVGDLSNNNSPIPLSGIVTSVSEATIRTESSGKLTRVYKKLSDRVYAGETIASFENSGERASVQQAEGQYESAKAARDIANINSATTNTNTGDVRTNALNVVTSTYTTLDDIVRGKTDIAYNDPRQSNVKIKLVVPDSLLVGKVEQERIAIEAMLNARDAKNKTLTSNTDFAVELENVRGEVQIVKTYLDDLSVLYTKALSDSSNQAILDGQKAVVSASRGTINGALSTVTGAKTSWTNSLAQAEISGKNGNTNPAGAAADASVKTALGSYNAALSRLEKTIIRSPINGTLNSLSIETGDFVGQSTQVAVVSNNGALEVQAYVSEDDSKRINVGSPVVINSNIKGVVTRIASAVDPVTKKIEVKIGILDEKAGLINGQSVRIEISNAVVKNTNVNLSNPKTIKIPLSAVKITPRGSFVFTLSASSTLVSVTVETGTLLGEEIQVVSGLTPEMQIVKDARGLKEGQVVETGTK